MNNNEQRHTDSLPNDPFSVIDEAWNTMPPTFIIPEIVFWSCMAMSHQNSLYTELRYRTRFIGFFADLLMFLEATYVYARKEQSGESPAYLVQYLSQDHRDDPVEIITRFCKKYPCSYTKVELWFFYQAVQFYEGPLRGDYEASEIHLHLLTLVDAFYLIVEAK